MMQFSILPPKASLRTALFPSVQNQPSANNTASLTTPLSADIFQLSAVANRDGKASKLSGSLLLDTKQAVTPNNLQLTGHASLVVALEAIGKATKDNNSKKWAKKVIDSAVEILPKGSVNGLPIVELVLNQPSSIKALVSSVDKQSRSALEATLKEQIKKRDNAKRFRGLDSATSAILYNRVCTEEGLLALVQQEVNKTTGDTPPKLSLERVVSPKKNDPTLTINWETGNQKSATEADIRTKLTEIVTRTTAHLSNSLAIKQTQ